MKVLCVDNTIKEIEVSSWDDSERVERLALEEIFSPLLYVLAADVDYLYHLKNRKVKKLNIDIKYKRIWAAFNSRLTITYKQSFLKKKKVLLSFVFSRNKCSNETSFTNEISFIIPVSGVYSYDARYFPILQNLYDTLEHERSIRLIEEEAKQAELVNKEEDKRLETEIMYSYG